MDGKLSTLLEDGKLTWMPAHKSLDVIPSLCKSDGSRVSVVDWRANQLADVLAKQGAPDSAVAAAVERLLDISMRAVEFESALLGVVTHAANNHRVVVANADGTEKSIIKRDAAGPVGRKCRVIKRKRSEEQLPTVGFVCSNSAPVDAALAGHGRSRGCTLAARRTARLLSATADRRAAQEARTRDALQAVSERCKPPAGPTAEERMAVVRAKIARRRLG